MDFKEKRRFERVELTADEALFLHLLFPESQDKARTINAAVSNVSMRGCLLRFENDVDFKGIQNDQKYVASLNVENFSIPLTVHIIRKMGNDGAAIAFKPPYPRELERLRTFLEPRTLGLSLREINPDAVKADSKGLRWFQGVNDTHLFSWYDLKTGEVNQQQLIFLGSVVEWKKDSMLKTGRVQAESGSTNAVRGWVQSELLAMDGPLNKATIEQARSLLQASKIDLATKSIFLNKLKD